MTITAVEKLMYEVMKALYDSGIPIDFKGSMVLKACLMEAGYDEDTRHTVDIDANWCSETPPSVRQMVNSLQNALTSKKLNLRVRNYRTYGEQRSAGFELIDGISGEILFTMDIDVDRPVSVTKLYEVEGVRFCGAAPVQMIADKISVISTDRVFRRIKDVVDLYYLSKITVFDLNAVTDVLEHGQRRLENFNGFLKRIDELQYAYDKFRFTGNVNKPPFEELYETVKSFIKDILPEGH